MGRLKEQVSYIDRSRHLNRWSALLFFVKSIDFKTVLIFYYYLYVPFLKI